MTPLERAARELCKLDGKEPDAGPTYDTERQPFSGPESSEPNWKGYVEHARAVLVAIREPSEPMKKAGAFCEPFMTEPGARPMTPGQIIACSCYEAMIDAALAER